MKERGALWTEYEENQLIEIVNEYVLNGDTKTSAFKAASEELGRTASACKSRWNSVLKEKTETSDTAPKESSKHQKPELSQIKKTDQEPILYLDEVITFLEDFTVGNPNCELVKENQQLKEEFHSLNKKHKQLLNTLAAKQEQFTIEMEKYESVLIILMQADQLLKQEPIRMVH
ncbi:Myb-like DNA-binding domain-containing protein [Bacillus sp. S/N-304-OC-R1]|uniref:Myb-like DNA-binding domain-containing protein n=1 Tax=Bacillus sp. S/N-304-OC-R1 TaxID=2758034 RepID=UPI001C8E9996|nr:Myb-like DNA-binding domain-containing protein [Bacillus sp. S/N-304-OC-R1]MBY0123908.1 hypothetical protein [Bacillus sp. S/N-304-OC-R1]